MSRDITERNIILEDAFFDIFQGLTTQSEKRMEGKEGPSHQLVALYEAGYSRALADIMDEFEKQFLPQTLDSLLRYHGYVAQPIETENEQENQEKD